jgi:hypothetical protein
MANPIKSRGPRPKDVIEKISKSLKGRDVWNKGKVGIYSEETRKRMGEKNIGKRSWNSGKKLSLEHCQHLSDSHKGHVVIHSPETCAKISNWRRSHRDLISGPNASNWRGGKSYEPYCPKFNENFKEFIRDKFDRKCFICGKSEAFVGNARKQRLHIHHVDYNKNDICNGYSWPFIPLCPSCHAKTNYNRWYWFNKYMNYWVYNYIDFMNILITI